LLDVSCISSRYQMETRGAAKRKERSAGASKGQSDPGPSDLDQPPAKRTRASRANQASASAGARTTSRSNQKGGKQASAASNRNRNTPDAVANPAAASDQAQQVPSSEAPPQPSEQEAPPAPAAADMDKSGRRGSKGEPASGGGADDERVRGPPSYWNCCSCL